MISNYANEIKVVVELTATWNTRHNGEKVEVPVHIADMLLNGHMAVKTPKGTKPDPQVRRVWDQGNLSDGKESELVALLEKLVGKQQANQSGEQAKLVT